MVIKIVSKITDLQNDENKDVSVVHFYADWSEECKHIDSIFEALSVQTEFNGINFKKCAAESFPNISTTCNVTAVPTVLFFKNGEKIDEIIGADPVTLNSKLQKYVSPQSDDTLVASIIKSDTIVACIKNETSDSDLNKELTSILDSYKTKFKTYDVTTDEAAKQKLITFSGSPSFPHLYIKGEFVGDLETIKRLNSTSELSTWIEAALKNLNRTLVQRLASLIKKSDIMIFMKGDRYTPRCGFSRQLMEILKETGLTFDTFDILTDEDVRQGLKIYSNWPTYPQIYVKGELIGGLDIIKSLKEDGELISTLKGDN